VRKRAGREYSDSTTEFSVTQQEIKKKSRKAGHAEKDQYLTSSSYLLSKTNKTGKDYLCGCGDRKW
jgi:hypothetical protein